jgi:hypothetical protein
VHENWFSRHRDKFYTKKYRKDSCHSPQQTRMSCLYATLERNLTVRAVSRAHTQNTRYTGIPVSNPPQNTEALPTGTSMFPFSVWLFLVPHSKRGTLQASQDQENCALPGYYAASSGNSLPAFRDNLSVPSSRLENPSRNH